MISAEEIGELDSVVVGQRIKTARIKAGIKSIDLATELKISTTHMSKIENGSKKCTCENLYKIVKLLGTSADYLLYGDTVKGKKAEIIHELDGMSESQMDYIMNMVCTMKGFKSA